MSSISIIIGNVCSILAMITDTISSTRKTAKGVLVVQNISQTIYGIGTLILKGYSGAVQNAVSILRNFVAMRKIESKVLEWVLVLLGVVLGILFNNLGLVGLLPVIANLQYTLVVFRFRNNDRALKWSFAVAVGLFAVFNLAILNFVGACTNFVTMIATIVVLLKKTPEKKEAE